VRFELRDGDEFAIKDYRSRPLWIRLLFGRPALRRELRAYERLGSMNGVPRCFGLDTPDSLLLERLHAHSLTTIVPGRTSEKTFREAGRILEEIHRRGVAIADLHRSNLLIDGAGRPFFVDFSTALVARDPSRLSAHVRAAMRLDRHALARIRARALGEREPELDGWLGLIYRAGHLVKRLARLTKRDRGGRCA
jgi:tRNA A-37 threonylcarbamoyl transferase component Bud32